MPTISLFYGIAIRMYLNDHPPPHFHAMYAGHEATFAISDGRLLEGHLPNTAGRLVLEWLSIHRADVDENWNLMRSGMLPNRIEGLDAE